MKRARTEEEEEADNILEPSSPLYRKPDALIQREWRHAIETTLVSFIKNSPLKSISANISPDFYGNMSPFLVKEILRMAKPVCGVHLALHAIVETMEAICVDAVHRLMDQAGDLKNRQSITLLCETLPMPAFTREQLNEDESLKNKLTLQMQHVIENDRHRNWLDQYVTGKAKSINVFTVKLGPGTEKATPETGRYIVSALMPMTAPDYQLRPRHETHINNYEELDATFRRTVIELDSHKRMAAALATNGGGGGGGGANTKKTLHDEAVELSKQMQDKRVVELKRQCDSQCIHIRMLTSDLQEITTLLASKEQKDVAAMRDTVLLLVDKLKESRRRNLDLINCLQQKSEDNKTMRFQQRKASAGEPVKHYKKARNAASSSSSSTSDGSYDEGQEDSFTKSTGDDCSYSTSSHKENDDSC